MGVPLPAVRPRRQRRGESGGDPVRDEGDAAGGGQWAAFPAGADGAERRELLKMAVTGGLRKDFCMVSRISLDVMNIIFAESVWSATHQRALRGKQRGSHFITRLPRGASLTTWKLPLLALPANFLPRHLLPIPLALRLRLPSPLLPAQAAACMISFSSFGIHFLGFLSSLRHCLVRPQWVLS